MNWHLWAIETVIGGLLGASLWLILTDRLTAVLDPFSALWSGCPHETTASEWRGGEWYLRCLDCGRRSRGVRVTPKEKTS